MSEFDEAEALAISRFRSRELKFGRGGGVAGGTGVGLVSPTVKWLRLCQLVIP